MKQTPSRSERPVARPEWCRSSALVDVRDAKLRSKARALVNAQSTSGEKAQAIYTFVRRLPFTADVRFRARTAREVLERGSRDASEKATLLIGLLRAAGLPARVKFLDAPRDALRGLPMDVAPTPRPYVEVMLGGRWLCTDTYIFDAGYLSAAQQRLRREHSDCGYGILAGGAGLWEPHRHACLLGADAADELVEGRPFHDPLEYARSLPMRQRLALWVRQVRWNLSARRLDEMVRRMRAKVRGSAGMAQAQPRKRRPRPAVAPFATTH